MAINGFVGRLAVLIAYDTEEVRQILASMDEAGNISVNDESEHNDDVFRIDRDTDAVSDLSDSIEGFSVTPIASEAGEATRGVRDLVWEVSGRITSDDNTSKDWVVQFADISGVSEFRELGQNDLDNLEEALNDSDTFDKLEELFNRAGLNIT